MPLYWERVATFSVRGKELKNRMTPEDARSIIENTELLDKDAPTSDDSLTTEILEEMRSGCAMPIGVVLISKETIV